MFVISFSVFDAVHKSRITLGACYGSKIFTAAMNEKEDILQFRLCWFSVGYTVLAQELND